MSLSALAGNYTRANFSHFVEKEAARAFNDWLSEFSATSIPPPSGEGVPSSNHEEEIAAKWYEDDDMVYGVTSSDEFYAIPLTELASMPSVELIHG